MKRTVALGLFSLVLIFAFAAVPVVGILSVSVQNAGGENLTLDIPDSVGTGTVDTPLTKRQLQKKYAKYNTVTEENGKSVVTIFSEEQIDDFNARRNNGEWFWLSTEEMLFLIEDTIRLFETYDLVYIRGLDGVLHKYYGLSFFSSEEYYASFGGFDLGVTDASFDLKQDVYETILERAQTLNNLILDGSDVNSRIAVTDIVQSPDEQEMKTLQNHDNPWCSSFYDQTDAQDMRFCVWEFYQQKIMFEEVTAKKSDFSFSSAYQNVFTNALLPVGISSTKYDNYGTVIVIELYEEESQKLIARIRLDKSKAVQTEKLLNEFASVHETPGNVFQEAQYRVLIYFNGTPFWLQEDGECVIYYFPDGEISFCGILNEFGNVLDYDMCHFSGFEKVGEYINGILKSTLEN